MKYKFNVNKLIEITRLIYLQNNILNNKKIEAKQP